jgi:hypothetical protein
LKEAVIAAAIRPYNVMANAVVDSLCEKAVDVLGHSPLYPDTDKWVVEEEDLAALCQHLPTPE